MGTLDSRAAQVAKKRREEYEINTRAQMQIESKSSPRIVYSTRILSPMQSPVWNLENMIKHDRTI